MKEFTKGLIKENPLFVILIGLCPALAITTRLINAFALGGAVLIVLLAASLIVSGLRNFIPVALRLPASLIIIGTLVTVVDLLLTAWQPALARGLGIFLPLIAVNCLILGRAQSFAYQRKPGAAALDALGMGIGFTLALALVAFLRETIGSGTITLAPPAGLTDGGIHVPGLVDAPLAVLAAPAGAFLAVGLLCGLLNQVRNLRERSMTAKGKKTAPDEQGQRS